MISELTNLLPAKLIEDLDKSLSSELVIEKENADYDQTQQDVIEKTNSAIDSTMSSPSNESSLISSSLINLYFSGDLLGLFTKQKSAFFFQKLLFKLTQIELAQIIFLFKGKYSQVIQDPYGNYFCSDLFKLATQTQRLIILEEISVDLPKISCSQYGTHPIQTLMQICSSIEEQSLLVKYINSSPIIIEMSVNPNGTYVIQKMLHNLNYSLKFNIYKIIINNFLVLVLDMNGVCVIKSLMKITVSLFERELIISHLVKNFFPIAMNTYGNYAIQHALNLWWYLNIKALKETIIQYFSILGECRNSSYIAELFISKLNQKERSSFISFLLKTGQLASIAKSKSGVFIINQVFGFVSLSEREYIVNALKNQSLFSGN